MSKSKSQTSEFSLVGQLLGLVIKDGCQVKYLRVTVSEREYWIKPPKELRQQLPPEIIPGCWLEISGTRKHSLKTGKLKLKAETVRLEAANREGVKGISPARIEPAPVSILVCQKSSCWQRGGKAICQLLEEELQSRGLADRVSIKRTGCLKQCKRGPNLVFMPNKARYSNVKPQQVPSLLDKYTATKKAESRNKGQG